MQDIFKRYNTKIVLAYSPENERVRKPGQVVAQIFLGNKPSIVMRFLNLEVMGPSGNTPDSLFSSINDVLADRVNKFELVSNDSTIRIIATNTQTDFYANREYVSKKDREPDASMPTQDLLDLVDYWGEKRTELAWYVHFGQPWHSVDTFKEGATREDTKYFDPATGEVGVASDLPELLAYFAEQ
jgi:hypothetical protein